MEFEQLKLKAGENMYLNSKNWDIINEELALEEAAFHFGKFLTSLGYDWNDDDNMKDTPKRVAKMYINELFKGVYAPKPKVTVFDNNGKYDGIIFEGNIEVKSMCSHHFMPFVGKAHVAYLPKEKAKIIGLSKINRIVDWFARRPQLQENLTIQIHDYINEIIQDNLGVAVTLEAKHFCVYMRGVEHDSIMKTTKLSGVFREKDNLARTEFYNFISNLKI